MSVAAKMTELADAVRDLIGGTDPLTLDDMVRNIRDMSTSDIISSTEGEALYITDCMARKLHGLTIYGKTNQNRTPTPYAPVMPESAGDDGNIIVHVDEQTLTVSTPNGLPGIPVDSDGNYTDASGQQWLCDEIDFTLGKYIQRIGVKIASGSTTDTIGQVAEIDNYIRWAHGLENAGEAYVYGVTRGFFSHGTYIHKFTDSSTHAYVGNKSVIYTIPKELAGTTVAEIRAYELAQHAAGTPLTVLYPLLTPIETDLTAGELAAYSLLRTNYPQTTIYNDEGAWMTVKYAADTKTYIDNQVAEAVSAIYDETEAAYEEGVNSV